MSLKVLFIGDIVGLTGRLMFQKHIEQIRNDHHIDVTIVNGENSADDGRGITPRIMNFFQDLNVNVVTSGNHIWAKRDIYPYFEHNDDLLRPANFPIQDPGKGVIIFQVQSIKIAVINIQGRVFMREHLACPFQTVDSLLTYLEDKTNLIFVDIHAETTAEKAAMAYYLDGRVSGIVGTHTHVQTADERILPQGTAFITDLGMVGALDSSIGMQKEEIIQHFITQMPHRFKVETKGPGLLCGAIIEVDELTGKALAITRIRFVDDQFQVESKMSEVPKKHT